MYHKKMFLSYRLVSLANITGFLFTIIFIACSDKSTPPETDDNQLEYVTPEAVGYSSDLLEDAKQFAEQSGFAAVMALYDGKVFFHWGNLTYNYKCHSIRKPFLNIFLFSIFFILFKYKAIKSDG